MKKQLFFSRRRLREGAIVFCLFVLSVTSSVLIARYTKTLIHREETATFDLISKELKSLITSRYNRLLDVARSVDGFMRQQKEITQNDFDRFAAALSLETNYPGILEVGFRTTDESGKKLLYSYGVETSNAISMITDTPSEASVVSVPGRVGVFLLLLPTTKADGVSYIVFQPTSVFSRLFYENSFYGSLDFKIATDETAQTIIFDSSGLPLEDYTLDGFFKKEQLSFLSVPWVIFIHAPESVLIAPAAQRLPIIIITGGTIVSLLLLIMLYALYKSRSEAIVLAEKMTVDLKQSEEKYKNIFNSLQDVYYRTDQKGLVTTVSPSIAKYLGVSAETVIGKNATSFYKNPNERNGMLAVLSEKGEVKDYPVSLVGKDGATIFASLNAQLLKNEKGESVGVQGILRDITSRKLAEDALQDRSRDLERMNKLMVGRELRMIELKRLVSLKEEETVEKVPVKRHARKK